MANLKGTGSMKAVPLVGVFYDNGVAKDKDGNDQTRFIDFQVDHRDSRGAEQTNAHLSTQHTKDKNDKRRINNGVGYSAKENAEKPSQFAGIIEAAGKNHFYDKKTGKHTITVTADVMPSSKGDGLVVNTKTLEGSEFTATKTTADKQFEAGAKARSAAAAEREAAVEAAPIAGAPAAEAVEATADEPALG